MAKKNSASKAYKKEMDELLKKVKNVIYTVSANTINELMLQSADDYEEIYQKCVRKFYSTYATKKYIRHGNDRAGIKKGNNLYRASISSKKWVNWNGNDVLVSVETDRELYQEDTSYDTSRMMSYRSLSKRRDEPVDPYVIVSNMMNGIRYPDGLGWLKGKGWSTGKLSINTSIGPISYSGSPIDLINYYDQEWEKTFYTRFETQLNKNLENIL